MSSLYCSGLTTEQVGKIYEQFYGKHYSKSQVSRLLNTAREDVNAWLGRKLEKRYPILYIDARDVSPVGMSPWAMKPLHGFGSERRPHKGKF